MKRALAALVAAVITEAILLAVVLQFGKCGSADGIAVPNTTICTYLYLHLPGMVAAEYLHLSGETVETVFIPISGILQFFLLYWLAIVIWSQTIRCFADTKHKDDVTALPRPSPPASHPP